MPRAFANYTLHDRSKSQIVVCQWEAFFSTGLLADSYVICVLPRPPPTTSNRMILDSVLVRTATKELTGSNKTIRLCTTNVSSVCQGLGVRG